MSKPEANKRILAKVPDLAPEQLKNARATWSEQNIHRKIITAEANSLIEELRNKLEHVAKEDLDEAQGQITGIKRLMAAIRGIHEP